MIKLSDDPELRRLEKRYLCVLVGACLLLVATAAAVAIFDTSPASDESFWPSLPFATFAFSALGGLALESRFSAKLNRRRAELAAGEAQIQRQQRIERLTQVLSEANEVIADLQHDVDEGQRLAAEVEARVRQQQALAEITQPQKQALADVLRDEVAAELTGRDRLRTRRDLAMQVGIGAFFFILGLVVGTGR